MRLAKTDPQERGAAVLEGALILLVFLTVFFAIWEGGRLMNVQQVVTNAAREGARFAVTPLSQTSCLPSDIAIRSRVNTFLQSANINVDPATAVSINKGNGIANPTIVSGNQYTRVEVAVPYSFLSLPLLNLSAILNGDALMKNEALYACP